MKPTAHTRIDVSELIVPLIQTALDRQARLPDAFRRTEQIVPLIQAALDRQARLTDAFRSEEN